MPEKHLTFEELAQSGLNFDPKGWGTELLLGVVTRAYDSPDEAYLVDVGDQAISYQDLVDRLDKLSDEGAHTYSRTDIGDRDRQITLLAVGRVLPGLMLAGEQSSNGFVPYETLFDNIGSIGDIVRDLESIGFKDVSPKDIILTAYSYQH